MGEEVRMTEYDGGVGGGEDRIFEWEEGLPSADDLTPLSQPLISPELAWAFRITPEPFWSVLDVNRASKNTLSSLRNGGGGGSEGHLPALSAVENDLIPECSDSRKVRKIIIEGEVVPAGIEEADSATPNWVDDSSGATKTLKRPRLVWTPQLHKRFVDVVAHLGINNAVPKTIMQLMNVEGLTRENVASHLQKYRLYLKRMQDGPGPGPAPPPDHFFASTPVPQSLQQSDEHGQQSLHQSGGYGQQHMSIHMPYPPPQMVSMPMIGMAAHGHGHGGPATGGFHGYNMLQQRDWSGNKFGSIVPYHHVARNDK